VSKVKAYTGNPLGDLKAEADHPMLDMAFFETPDYLSLIETADKTVVVGRRGVGKSALAYQLSKYWHDVPKTRVTTVALDEAQMIGLVPLIELFGDSYRLIRAGCCVAWRYALIMEITLEQSSYYKFDKADTDGILARHVRKWRAAGDDPAGRLRKTLAMCLSTEDRPETRVADLAEKLDINVVERAFDAMLSTLGFTCILLVDRLDEGYEPTDLGVGVVDGIVEATISLNQKHEKVRPTLFLRDNMFRAMAKRNPDYSRNVEGQILRLHWTEYQLLNMVCNRLRATFGIRHEQTLRTWDACAVRELSGHDGFRKCLQLTLYRPRDILVLLNEAFYAAFRENREQIVLADVNYSAKAISVSRIEDLHKEYTAIIPGLEYLTGAFASGTPEFTLSEVESLLGRTLSSPALPVNVQQVFAIIESPIDVLRALYGIGFLGVRDDHSGTYVFCHDGKSPDREISREDRFLIHPCYWMALNLMRDALAPPDAEEIHDEYDINVTADSPELRRKKLNQLISGLGNIPVGEEEREAFGTWCFRAISTAFAGALRNIELLSSSRADQRWCIVALNLGRTEAWERILQDFGCRQVVFFLVNARDIGRDRYTEAVARLSEPNGNMVFIVTRDDSMDMDKHSSLGWVREIGEREGVLAVKLTATFLAGLVGKLRNPQKHDAVDRRVNHILDTYCRRYEVEVGKGAKGASKSQKRASKKEPEPASISIPPDECYGELAMDGEARLLLRVFKEGRGPGRRTELCPAISLNGQAYRILEAGIVSAREQHIRNTQETAKHDGLVVSASECEPADAKTFDVSWSRDDLALVLLDKGVFSGLNKRGKATIKTAMSRLRKLVVFPDSIGLVTEPDHLGRRHTTIPLRFRKSAKT